MSEQHLRNMSEALDQAQLAIYEYHNGDRGWAEEWLLKAYEANQEKVPDYLIYDFHSTERD